MINKLLIKMGIQEDNAQKMQQFARFGLVGLTATLVNYAAYWLLVKLLSPTPSWTIGYIAGCLCNYFMTTYFTFSDKPTTKNAAGFAATTAINYLMQIAVLNLFLRLGTSEQLAPIFMLIIVAPINFLILKIVYKK